MNTLTFKNKLSIGIGAAIGNILEWYDFILYALFATIIANQFFSAASSQIRLLYVFVVFAVGYFMRPLGGALIGHIGDKYSRKIALILTISTMGIATALIGILPTYTTLGIAAPLLLILLRIIQGIALGGEYPGSLVVLTEIANKKYRASAASVGLSAGLLGALLGVGVSNLLSSILNSNQLANWGWRIPFILGIFLAGIGLYLRFKIFPEIAFKKADEIKIPFLHLIKYQKLTILKAWLMLFSAGVYTGILTIFLVAYTTHYLHMELKTAFRLSLLVNLIILLLFPVGAFLSDKVGHHKCWLIIGSIMVAVTAYPLYVWMNHSVASCFWAFSIMAAIYSIGLAPISAFLVLLFPPHIRYSGFAISHGLSFSIIGGTSPIILNWLAYHFNTIAPSFYGILSCVITIIALYFTQAKNFD